MTQRLLGASLIVLGGSFYGLALARTLHTRVRELQELIRALHLLEGEIAFARAPLPEALERVGRTARGAVGRLFSQLAAELGSNPHRPIGHVWSGVVANWSGRSALETEELAALEGLGALVGRTGVDDQVRALRYTAERISGIVKRLESSVERDARLRLYLGVAGGVALAILLV